MSETELNGLIEALEAVQNSAQPTEADWKQILFRIEAYTRKYPQDAHGHYVLGYAYFSQGGNLKHPEIEAHLRRSLELEPGVPFPLFYLGMYYFNLGLHEKALRTLSDIDFSFFESIGQYYRISEVLEVRLCCQLYLDPAQVEVADMAALTEELVRLARLEAAQIDDDVSLYAVTPYALTRCVDALFHQPGQEGKAAQMFDLVFECLLKLGQEQYVAREIERVRARL